MKSIQQRHHFVPRFLLKKFTHDGKDKIWALNTKYNSVKEYSVEQIACLPNLYDQPYYKDLEQRLSFLESNCAKVIDRIIETKSLDHLTQTDKIDLSLFVLLQQKRTTAELENAAEFQKEFRKRIVEFGKGEISDDYTLPEGDPVELWTDALAGVKDLVPHLFTKKWGLALSDRHFYISDNPSVMWNDIIREHRGNLGLNCKGIQLYLPLSHSITLCIVCPESFPVSNNFLIPVMPDFIERLNSLQVINSEGFVYSSSKNFILAKDMVAKGQNQRPKPFFS